MSIENRFPTFLTVSLILLAVVSIAQAQYSGGSGTPDDPYQIATAADLIALGETPDDCDKHFILTADIDLDPNLPDGRVFQKAVIAPGYRWYGHSGMDDWDEWHFEGDFFVGVFDGNGHTIRNLTGCRGLIGGLGSGAEIKDLGVIEVNITSPAAFVGGLVCVVEDGLRNPVIITRCYTTGIVTALGSSSVGGLVGYNRAKVTECHSTAVVSGEDIVGGLVGENGGLVANCYSTGTVSGNESVGGLVGTNGTTAQGGYSGDVITSCSSGEVEGNECVGGLIGNNDSGSVFDCYSTGAVSGISYIGGLVGYSAQVDVARCYSTGPVSGSGDHIGGLAGYAENWHGAGGLAYPFPGCFWDVETSSQLASARGTGLTTVEMEDPSTFIAAGWDFVAQPDGPDDLWAEPEGGGYPVLYWQLPPNVGLPAFSGGTGEPNAPYLIATAEELNSIGYNPRLMKCHFKLIADIDLSAFDGKDGRPTFNTIGYGDRLERDTYYDIYTGFAFLFSGVFDGDGHTVSHLIISGDYYVGLFPYLLRGAQVQRLSVVDVNVTGGTAGGLVGYNGGRVTGCYAGGTINGSTAGGLVGYNKGYVSECYATGTINGSTAGGLVGRNSDSASVARSYSAGTVTGDTSVGGLVGENHYGSITMSYSSGTVVGENRVGGLVGDNRGNIVLSYNTGEATGHWYVGGLVGWNWGSVAQSYSTGVVKGTGSHVGGLVGQNLSRSVESSFWDIESSGLAISDGGTGKTAIEMQRASMFLDAGWDFVDENRNGTSDYWQISAGDYPSLRYLDGNEPVMPEGAGTAKEPYLIRDAQDFGAVWSKPMAHYRLETSVDLSEITWSIAVVPWFDGAFDGNGCVVSNLQIQGSGYLGLFGQLGSDANISNLGLEAVGIEGTGSYIGALVGLNGGSIATSHSTGIVGGDTRVGGLVGSNGDWGDWGFEGETVADCDSTGSITGVSDVGGLVGYNAGSISTCTSGGTVSGSSEIGGLVGSNYYGEIISDHSSSTVGGGSSVGGLVGYNSGYPTMSYSTGTVIGDKRVGGLVGYNEHGLLTMSYSTSRVEGGSCVGGLVGDNRDGWIAWSYSTGAVSGESDVGGLVGWCSAWPGTTSSFWDTETSGLTNGCGKGQQYSDGKTTAEMQTASTFLEAGWDFIDETENGTDDIWWILEGQGYPRLWWEVLEGN